MKSRLLIIISIILVTGCKSSSQTKTEQIDKLIRLATEADSLMDLTASVKYYSDILDLDSTKLIAHNNRGRAYIWLGHLDKGFEDFDNAIRLYPHERTFYTRGMTYLNINTVPSSSPMTVPPSSPMTNDPSLPLTLFVKISLDFSPVIF